MSQTTALSDLRACIDMQRYEEYLTVGQLHIFIFLYINEFNRLNLFFDSYIHVLLYLRRMIESISKSAKFA